ncbi:polymorphic toxin-type HINT domain-containing protein [Clostridium baratii]|uniref:polymorphic toxin-type HINT domain-containing protein n=1 Tax=Clostridium baratii TaxID=1561 RepID=UPI002915916E|nr:polymorphic toxin-type HINT domain-containing protein [Clostridium baratii]MDU4910903.1 polymorphic toxin-type HINT domain-containing protein [Clostridium baratii]
MRQVSIDYSNTQNLINNLRSILRNLDNEKREVNSALRELYDLENYYYNKGEIVQELEYRQRKISKDIESTEELINNISRFLNEVKEIDGNLANKFKQDIKAYAKKNNIDLVSDFERFLNKLQTGLDIVGCLPVIGDIADAINGVISLARGDIGTALISFIAVVPFVGDAAKGLKYLDKASGLLKLGDKAVDIGKATVKNATKKVSKTVKKEVLGIASKGEKAFKNVLEATLELGKNDYVTWIKNKGEVVLNTINDKLPESIQLCLNNGCLVGDTLVKTKEGLKEIREIKVGDLVLSKNEELGITEYKKVTEIHKNSAYESCRIRTKNSIIESTTGHLFMIKDKWWTAAIDIKENDYVELSKGSYEEILEIEYRENKYPVKVYNLTIEDNHNYFIEKDKVLTHNTLFKKNCKDSIESIKQVSELSIKDIPTSKSGEFNKFFNSLTSEELDELWKNKQIRKKIERELRAPGGLHEWHLVSQAPQFKYWNVTAERIKDLRSVISDVKFKNPAGQHGGLGSTKAHNELIGIVNSSIDYDSFIRRLNNWANYRLEGGINSLPEGLRLK